MQEITIIIITATTMATGTKALATNNALKLIIISSL
jgi:hypothetical protein